MPQGLVRACLRLRYVGRIVAARAAPVALAWLVLAGSGCSATGLGATEPQLAKARDRASAGADVFANECVRCHGKRGQGLAGAPEVLGPGALPEYPRSMSSGMQAMVDPDQLQIQQQTRPAGAPTRDVFRTADDLHTYIHDHLPKSRAAAMKNEDYWALVTFMLAVQGADVPPDGIGPNNASTFPIPR
ncbi:MAG TPA: c-type cytochrome [Polyangiaceae bacterium]|nr:c-type cytochrome [Polyangiaceae bacterium]